MKLPENVLAARERMVKADAAPHADIESDATADKDRHRRLLDELHLATDDYVMKITAAVARRCSEPIEKRPIAASTLPRLSGSAGLNRHVVGNERVPQERRQRLHLGPQSCR